MKEKLFLITLLIIASIDTCFAAENIQTPSGNLLYFFFMAFLGGIILNLMPCVLPVVSLKVFSLMKSAGEEKGKIFKAGLAFTAGVLFSFTVLALVVVVLKSIGQSVGWGFQFQSPYFVFSLALVVYVFGLSLFDLFEISPPSAEKIDKLAQKEGYIGAFFEGILAVLLATPCSAPFLGTALGFAFSQPGWIIFTVFIFIGLGLSTPYLLFTANPKLMSFLPRPGNWMLKLRVAMGFLLMGTVCWLLWVIGKQLSSDAVVSTVVFFLFIAISLWVFGFIEYKTSKFMRWIIRFISLAMIIAGFWTSYMWLYPFKNINSESVTDNVTANIPGEVINGVSWKKYTEEAFTAARKTGKIIFLDAYADWCLTCKTNENTVLYTDKVSERLRKDDIIVFKADNTKRSKEVTDLVKSLGKSAVPVYAVYPPGENVSPEILPEVITIQMVLDAIERASIKK
jgi:thiol:disulfide interchange protein DsbD